jgi:tripartite ATP-independent transporter DctM subunit
VGWIRGGLAMLNVVSSTFFGGISGSAVADVSSIGTVMIPMMTKQGYHREYSVAVTVSSAAQGVLIPPSHNMILYSLAAGGVSIGALFAAGLVPGLLLGASLLIATYVTSRRRNYPKGEFVGMKQVPKILRDGLLGLMAPVIIIGGILSASSHATESAAVACMYAMVITFGVYREIPLNAMGGIVRRSFYTLSVISFLIASASAFGYMLSILRLPTAMTTALIGLTDNPIAILLLVLLIMLGFGLIMDMAPLILILTPILLPVVEAVGMDPVHFGIVLVFTLALA